MAILREIDDILISKSFHGPQTIFSYKLLHISLNSISFRRLLHSNKAETVKEIRLNIF